MAEVVPFKGVRYNPELIPEMEAVVAPPYDVISPEEQEELHRRHPNNVIRLILGRHEPGDAPDNDVHSRAGRYLRSWLDERVLLPDPTPAFYLTSIDFSSQGQWHTRFGVIACVRLEPFDKGIILPHERTFSKVKSERLMLMKACHANLSPIFGLFTGGDHLLDRFTAIAGSTRPAFDLVDDKGHRHRLWCITERGEVAYLTSFFEGRRIYIADGHHRYETALNYRAWFQQANPGLSADHPANFVMMSLSSMVDPGLIILPAHRLLKTVSEAELAALIHRAGEFFDVFTISAEQHTKIAEAEFSRLLSSRAQQHAIGIFASQPSRLQVISLKEGALERLYKEPVPEVLADLDVTVLTHGVMMELMGFDQERLDDESQIVYRTNIEAAFQAIREGAARVAFILNPTQIEQVRRVAEKGLIMPRKSTYFYPKVISGLVYHLLR